VDGKTYTTTTTQYGNYRLYVITTTPGIKSITATYDGTETTTKDTNATTFTVNKKETLLTLGSTTNITIGNRVCIYGKLTADGIDVPNEKVSLTVGGQTFVVTTTQYGNYRQYVTTNKLGENLISAHYNGSDKYISSQNSTKFIVK